MNNVEKLIIQSEGIIYGIINKYKNYFELDDLYQVATIGVIKASSKYKSEYNTKFTTYAYPYILGEVIKYINNFRSVKLSKEYSHLYNKILKAKDILSQKLMKNPSLYELSIFLEIDESLISDVLIANTSIDSLDKIISEDDKNLELYDKFGYFDKEVENYPLTYAIDKLPLEERKFIEARYYNDMSQREVGNAFGMYQMEVSRKEKKILKKLYDDIAA